MRAMLRRGGLGRRGLDPHVFFAHHTCANRTAEALMGIIGFILFGLVVGLLARAIMPGRQSMGWIMTILLGVGGSFLGGFLASLITHRAADEPSTAGFIGSIIGALLPRDWVRD
jgi:uncharacterized membrane protein YeaQ/YmgE (transglycosylase-associated protein family)